MNAFHNLDPTLAAGIIGAVAVVVTALVTALITLKCARSSGELSKNMASVDYLNRKLTVLEAERTHLRSRDTERSDDSAELAESAAIAVETQFALATKAIERVSHYLNPERRKALVRRQKEISEAISFERAMAMGVGTDEWKGPRHSFENGGDILTAMIDLSNDVDRAIETELNESVRHIETLLNVP